MARFVNYLFDKLLNLSLLLFVLIPVGYALYWVFKEKYLARKEREWVERRRREIKEKAARNSVKPPV